GVQTCALPISRLFESSKEKIWIKARGKIQTDQFSGELAMMANDVQEINVARPADEATEKRVELHAHTTMSQLDAVVSPTRIIEQTHFWGHNAVAITYEASTQGFHEAYGAAVKYGMKMLYGVEANVVDYGVRNCYGVHDIPLNDGTYVVFDVESSGLSSGYDTIIELAGVKM